MDEDVPSYFSSYKQLVQLLETQTGPPLDFAITERNLICRISRATVSVSFTFQILRAMGVHSGDVTSVDPPPIRSYIGS
jgi:hypothetical protein